jgi:hypothetical protein
MQTRLMNQVKLDATLKYINKAPQSIAVELFVSRLVYNVVYILLKQGEWKMRSLQDKKLNAFLILAVFGVGLTFFGNLYEYVVFIPNLIGLGGINGLIAFRHFFVFANPVYFYIPLGVIGFISTFISYARMRDRTTKLNKWLKIATVNGIGALLITVIIVTEFNFKLFFGAPPGNDSNIEITLLLYYIVAFIRLVFDGLTLYAAFRAYYFFISKN